MRRLCLLVCLCAAAQAQPDTVPADLLYAVANVRDASAVVVGNAPARLLPLFPAGAEVLGTLGRAAWSGMVTDEVVPDRPTRATAIAHVDGVPNDVARTYALDPPVGWRAHNPVPPPEGGFASSPPLGFGVVLCPAHAGPEDEPVSVGFSLRPGGGTYVTVSEAGRYRVGCDGVVEEPPFGFGADEREVTLADLPVLSPPARARQQARGSGGSGDHYRQQASLSWDGAARDALRHYASQLEAAGWAPLASGGDAEAAAGTWTRSDDDGPLTVSVTVVRVEGERFDLRLIVASHA